MSKIIDGPQKPIPNTGEIFGPEPLKRPRDYSCLWWFLGFVAVIAISFGLVMYGLHQQLKG